MGSWFGKGALATTLAWAVLATLPAQAQDATKPDPARGRILGYTCLGCHGVEGYKNAFPIYSVPKLRGQHPEYLMAALKAYQSGERSHTTMHAQSESLSDQDIADIATFFAHEPVKSDPAAKPVSTLPAAASTCVACHGQNGVGITSAYPTLAGQHADYITRALLDYKRGARRNPIMGQFAGQLTDEQIEQIAAYYSQQKPSLETLNLRNRLASGN